MSRYQLIYPFVNNTVHRTKNQKKGVYACYLDLKKNVEYENITQDRIFIVLNLDEKVVMKYKIKDKRNKPDSYQQKLAQLESRIYHLEELVKHLL